MNPGFEDDSLERINPPSGWSYWTLVEQPDGTLGVNSWGGRVDLTPAAGAFSAGKVTDWGKPWGGFLQTVTAEPDGAYECSVWVRTPCRESLGDAGYVRLGVDPAGGDSPYAANVLWTEYTRSPESWREIGFFQGEEIIATASALTLFLELWQPEYRPWNAMLFDEARVWGPVSYVTPQPTATKTPVVPTPTAGTPTPDTGHVFGIGGVWAGAVPWEEEEAFNHRMLGRVVEAGARTHIWGIHWCVIEESRGTYDWSRYDRELNALTAHGTKPIGLIVTSPAWASFNGLAGNYPPGEHAAQDFIRFCAAAAARYRDRVRGYSFWNEPDIIYGWGTDPDPADYAQWQKRYYQGIKLGDPDAPAGTGGFLGRSLVFIETLYRDIGGEYFDAVIHPYPDLSGQYGQPYFDNEMISRYRGVMTANGDSTKPMWCTEFGWALDDLSFEAYSYYLKQSYAFMLADPRVTLSNLHIIADWDRNPNGVRMGITDVNLHPRPPYWDLYTITHGATPTPPPTPPSDAVNRIANGDFENDLSGWFVWHEDEYLPHGSVEVLATAGRNGLGLRVTGNLYDSGVYGIVTGLDPSRDYQMTAWVRSTNRDGTFSFAMAGADPTGQTVHGSASSIDYRFMAPQPNTWKQFVSNAFRPEGTIATIWLRAARQRSTAPGFHADFDDVMLVEAGGAETGSLWLAR